MQKRASLFFAAIGVFAASLAEAREGFGFTKKAVTMKRTTPPALNIGARRIRVEATADRSKESDDAQTLRRLTEELILNGGGTLAPDAKNAEVTVVVAVDRLNAHETWETKQTYESQKTGEKQVWDDKKKKYKTEPIYSSVAVTKQIKVIDAALNGVYDIEDKSGKVIDSSNLSETFKQKYDDGTGAPSPATVEENLMKRAATTIASRIVPTTDTVSVLVPKGSFESLIPLAEMNAWDRYRAAVEAIPAKSDKKSEAFRQYALGVAKEGLAYATADRDGALGLLREAAQHYENAVRNHPGEKLFAQSYVGFWSGTAALAPLTRATSSITAYEAWTSSAPGSRKGTTAVASKSVLTNQRLIEMAKAGLTDENLMLAIDSAEDPQFDTTPDGLIALAKSGVSRNVIAHMQKKTRR